MKLFHRCLNSGVTENNKSTFCQEFTSCSDLLQEYVAYCPRTFKYNGVEGQCKDNEEQQEDNEAKGRHEIVAERIKNFAKELTRLYDERTQRDNEVEVLEVVESEKASGEDGHRQSLAAKKGAAMVAEKKWRADNLMREFLKVMKGETMQDFVEYVLCASAVLEEVDRKA